MQRGFPSNSGDFPRVRCGSVDQGPGKSETRIGPIRGLLSAFNFGSNFVCTSRKYGSV